MQRLLRPSSDLLHVKPGEKIEMPAMYVGAIDKPVNVLEAIVHIMAGNQVSGDYGPGGENLMHPRYYID